jgi:hypothetical protein
MRIGGLQISHKTHQATALREKMTPCPENLSYSEENFPTY